MKDTNAIDQERQRRGSELAAEMREAIELLIAERDALKETLHNELDGNLRLRDLGGARPDECMTTFLERVFAERDQGRAALADVAMMLKVCAWALRRGTSPTLGERALVLLTKHGLMGSPLREGTRCTRLSADGEPCGLEPPCPDCGRACHDVSEGA